MTITNWRCKRERSMWMDGLLHIYGQFTHTSNIRMWTFSWYSSTLAELGSVHRSRIGSRPPLREILDPPLEHVRTKNRVFVGALISLIVCSTMNAVGRKIESWHMWTTRVLLHLQPFWVKNFRIYYKINNNIKWRNYLTRLFI